MNFCETVGIIAMIYLAPKVITYLLSLIQRLFSKNILIPRSGDFAIITGATDGIGLEYARQLAEKGYNLLLLSRTEAKLKKVRNSIIADDDVEVHTLAVDFTEINIYDAIQKKIDSLPGRVAVLVNNVGMMHPYPYEYTEFDSDINVKTLICNDYSVTKMCEIVLRIMKNQEYGIVINISSAIQISPIPYFSVYSASKAYMSTLTNCLAAEYREYGIVFQDVIPNHVDTNMAKKIQASGNTMFAVDPKTYVTYALNSVGKEFRTSAHPRHKLINNVFAFIENSFPNKALMLARSMLAKKIREKALKYD